MHLAPIVLFTFNRPRHTASTLEALCRNEEAKRSEVFIFSDGPRSEKDVALVAEVRDLLRRIRGFGKIRIVEREHNLGLSGSIIDGVTQVCASHGRAIVLEDDILVSGHFLRYVNAALDLYRDDERVLSIGCYTFPVSLPLPETFFFRVPDCWGWAVWQRSWQRFEPDSKKLLAEIVHSGREREFDLGGSYPYTRMLQDQVAGRNSSWAVRWYATAFLEGCLTLYPGRSMTRNIGMDGSGAHRGISRRYDVAVADEPVTIARVPIEEHTAAHAAIAQFLSEGEGGLLRRLRARLGAWVPGANRVDV